MDSTTITRKKYTLETIRCIAQGFLNYSANGLQPEPSTLKTIYDNALVILYRLLLHQLTQNQHTRGMHSAWHSSLFQPHRYPFLEQYTIAPAYLSQAIATLAQCHHCCLNDAHTSIGPHCLGSLHDELLSYQLEPIPSAHRAHEWSIALVKKTPQRRQLGTYYTPHAIIKDMIAHTLAPILQAKVAGLGNAQAKIAAVLTIKILDPAMGSGYFLLEATDYIAHFLFDLSRTAPNAEYTIKDIVYWKQRVLDTCIYGIDINPLTVDIATLSLVYACGVEANPTTIKHHLYTGNALEAMLWQRICADMSTDNHTDNPQTGFDIVIGNPPYVRQESFAAWKWHLAQTFPDVYHGAADLSTYFIAQALRVLKQGGQLSYITSGTFRKLQSGAALRKYLATHATLLEVVQFSTPYVFTETTTYPIILRVQNSTPPHGARFSMRNGDYVLNADGASTTSQHPLPCGDSPWIFTTHTLQHIIDGWSMATPLANMLDGPIYRGITTGLNEAFIIDQTTRDTLMSHEPHSADVIKPMLRGQDIHPWHHHYKDMWLLLMRRGVDIEHYPAIKAYLQRFRKRLEPRPADCPRTTHWHGRGRGAYLWYELQNPVRNDHMFEQQRIFSSKVSRYPAFSYAYKPLYATNTCYILPIASDVVGYYLMGILNSHVCEYYCRTIFSPKANGYYEVQPRGLSRFPIPHATPTQRDTIAHLAMQISQEAQQRHHLHNTTWSYIAHTMGNGREHHTYAHKLKHWWKLDLAAFMHALAPMSENVMTPAEHDEWAEWFVEQRMLHTQATANIVRLETALNEHIYTLFEVQNADRHAIEALCTYQYGTV